MKVEHWPEIQKKKKTTGVLLYFPLNNICQIPQIVRSTGISDISYQKY